MNKLLFFGVLTTASIVGFSTNVSADGHKEKAIIALTEKVPAEVMREFESTFVFDDEGYFIGARIDMLRPYLNSAEILGLVRGLVGAKDIVYEGYKPKSPRGCKSNNRWVCVLRNIDEVH